MPRIRRRRRRLSAHRVRSMWPRATPREASMSARERAPEDRPEQRIALEAGAEGHEVVVQVEREAHALDRMGRGLTRRRLCAQADCAPGGPGTDHRGLLAEVDQAGEDAVPAP